MVAFATAEEADFALIGRTKLAEPPECKIVLALGTPDLDGGQGFHLLAFIIDNHDLIFPAFNLLLHLVGIFDLAGIPALPALELAS